MGSHSIIRVHDKNLRMRAYLLSTTKAFQTGMPIKVLGHGLMTPGTGIHWPTQSDQNGGAGGSAFLQAPATHAPAMVNVIMMNHPRPTGHEKPTGHTFTIRDPLGTLVVIRLCFDIAVPQLETTWLGHIQWQKRGLNNPDRWGLIVSPLIVTAWVRDCTNRDRMGLSVTEWVLS